MDANNKILFFKQRSAGELLEVTLQFLKENWRPLLIMSVYVLLPVALLQGWLMNNMMSILSSQAMSVSDMSESMMGEFIVSYSGLFLSLCLGSLFTTALAMTMLRAYNNRPYGLNKIKWGDVKGDFLKMLLRTFVFVIVTTIIMVVAILLITLLVAVSPWTLLLTVPLFFWASVSYVLAEPVYLLEDRGLFASIARGFRLGMSNWGKLFIVMVVLVILISIVSGIFSIPLYVAIMARDLLGVTGSVSSAALSVLSYAGSVLSEFVGAVLGLAIPIAAAYIFSDAAERKDGMTIVEDIEHFDTL